MQLTHFLSGRYFSDLLQHGREVDITISRKDDSLLRHSTIDMERWFAKSSHEMPKQNGFPLALALLLFLLVFALDMLTMLAMVPSLPYPLHALLFFAPSILFILSNLTATYLIARGKTAGLLWYSGVYHSLALASLLLLFCALVTGDMQNCLLMVIALFLWFGCRYLFNSRAFIAFVLFCRTQRIAALARAMRLARN
ncbi:hypothetical protein B1H58_17250 [Pantoea alhagi]|uniref:Uncharacterized protein n=1 Tax=Pantoea alhagi TaxID=1891675 RepID=A0A1W6B929_9GAMM|nr:hypothetical protein [Pantoea alhagi]ARJ43615.1 hypothetical protein B1H58_17250 [Pantoea alhagi]